MRNLAASLLTTAVANSLWIGAVVFLSMSASRRLLHDAGPRHRHLAEIAALLLLIAATVAATIAGPRLTGPWTWWVAAGWAAGALTMLLRIADSWRRVNALLAGAKSAGADLQRVIDEESHLTGISAQVRGMVSSALEGPGIVGVWHPVLLMPACLPSAMEARHLRALVAHELAHVRRRDYVCNLALSIGEAIGFYHPVVRNISAAMRRERERCCDDSASTHHRPIDLAESLAMLERARSRPANAAAASPALLERVRNLVIGSARPAVESSASIVTLAVALPGIGVTAAYGALWSTGLAPLAPPPFWFSLAASASFGMLLGLRHAFEPDHLVAVATMVSQQRNPRAAFRLGASWGVGHTLSLFVVGSVLAFARRAMPDMLGTYFELAVAIMVVAIGMRTLYLGWQMGKQGPRQWHTHGGSRHQHETSGAHIHLGPVTLARQPLLVGIMHGLAGSGALTAMAVSSLASIPAQIIFMLLFGIGSTLGMAAVSGLAGLPLARFVQRPYAAAMLSMGTGLSAVAFGVLYFKPLVALLAR